MIEQDLGFVADLDEALSQIDPKLQTVRFATSTEFLAWMEKLQAHDPELSPPLPTDVFHGLITSIESWKFKDVRLIGKFKTLFVQKKLAAKEEDIFVLFTGFETPTFQLKRFESKSVNNVIFKPFDKLLLKQLIDVALKGRVAVKTHYTHVLKAVSKIEMLKEIRLLQVGEISFKTVSDQTIEPGLTAKYYADFFETRQHRSGLAQVLKTEPHTGDRRIVASAGESGEAAAGVIDVTLRFFALDQTQSFNIQKLAQTHKNVVPLIDKAPAPNDYEFVFIEQESSVFAAELKPSFERFFDHKISSVPSIAYFTKELATYTAKKVFVLIDHAHIAQNEAAEVASLRKLHPNLSVFILTRQILSEELEVELSSLAEDIFYAPFNRSSIVKGLKLRYPDLANKEVLFENVHDVEQTIHVSTPVQLLEVSEANLVISYRREIPLGSFREFVLWLPNEAEVPTLLAQCNFNEKSADGKGFKCHFIFFGLGDHELKFIRRWMLLQYVDAKQKGE